MKFESRIEFRCFWKIFYVAQKLRKSSHWCFHLTRRNFIWKQHVKICLEKDYCIFVSKANMGLVIVLLHLVFLPSPVHVMSNMLYLTQLALITSTFGERAKYPGSPIHSYTCPRSKEALVPAFLSMLQPRLQVALSEDFCVTSCIKWRSKSSVISDVLGLPMLQRDDNIGSCFLGDNFSSR